MSLPQPISPGLMSATAPDEALHRPAYPPRHRIFSQTALMRRWNAGLPVSRVTLLPDRCQLSIGVCLEVRGGLCLVLAGRASYKRSCSPRGRLFRTSSNYLAFKVFAVQFPLSYHHIPLSPADRLHSLNYNFQDQLINEPFQPQI
jgi:hypothetical protein